MVEPEHVLVNGTFSGSVVGAGLVTVGPEVVLVNDVFSRCDMEEGFATVGTGVVTVNGAFSGCDVGRGFGMAKPEVVLLGAHFPLKRLEMKSIPLCFSATRGLDIEKDCSETDFAAEEADRLLFGDSLLCFLRNLLESGPEVCPSTDSRLSSGSDSSVNIAMVVLGVSGRS